MRKFFTRDFAKDSDRLIELFALRSSGWPMAWLSVKYEKDRTSLRIHLKAHSIEPVSMELQSPKSNDFLIPIPRKAMPDPRYYVNEFGERICRGKSYMDYVAAHKKRDPSWKFVINPLAADPDSLTTAYEADAS